MKIAYRPHLIRRIKERRISKNYPRTILQEAEQEYLDKVTNHYIAIKRLLYEEKTRNIVVVYDIIEGTKEAITIYPISDSEIRNKVSVGRWVQYEKN